MENRTNQLIKKATEIMGDDADILIIAHKDGKCGAVCHGSTDNVAHAIFSCIHQKNEPISKVLYRIVKLNVMNIISNPSPYAENILDSITSILPDDEE